MKAFLLCVVSSVLCVLAGCGPAQDDDVTLEFWGLGREGEVARELLDAFEARHPGIRVEVQQVPFISAHEKLLTAYAGDATPDVFQLYNTWVPEFVALEALENLDPWIARSAAIDSTDYFSGIWDTNRIGGHVYAIPWYVDTRLLFYRKDLLARAGFEAPPETWAAWRAAMEAVKREVGEDGYAILLPNNEWAQPVILGLQAGADLLRDSARYGNFSGPRFREAFDFYLGLYRDGLAPKVNNAQMANLYQEFARGYFSMYVTGPWNIGEFSRRLPDSLQSAWSTMPMPGRGGAYPGVSLAGGAGLAIFNDSEHKEEAWQLIAFLSEPAQQVRFHELTGNLPPRESTWQDPVFAANPYAQAFREQLQHVVATPKIPEWERITKKFEQYLEEAVRGQKTAEEALAALDRDVDRILEKRRWLLERQQE
jgi:multiple sugar transport system substrate-binding protein